MANNLTHSCPVSHFSISLVLCAPSAYGSAYFFRKVIAMTNPYQSPNQNQPQTQSAAGPQYETQQFSAQPATPSKPKKPIWKKWWFWLVAVIAVFAIFSSLGKDTEDTTSSTASTTQQSTPTSQASPAQATAAAPIEATPEQVEAAEQAPQPTQPQVTAQENDVPREYKSALNKAETYTKMMHMSRQGVYDQLTSEYGEGFSPEAAQYAVDHLDADYNAAALEKAKSYQDSMSMSPSAIYDQLISPYGEQFTPEQAQYAIDNLPQ